MLLEINGIECQTTIGCYDYEQQQSQPVMADIILNLGNWDSTDNICQTTDYAAVSDFIKEKINISHHQLLESLAIELAQQILDAYHLVIEVTIILNKPNFNNTKAQQTNCRYSKKREYKIALALGSNQNNPTQQLINAITFLGEFVFGIKVAAIYKSSPQGFTDQNDYFNTCISAYTHLTPEELLIAIKKVEKLMGKQEQFTNGPRIIDIDIILFADQSYQKLFLTIPHPRMSQRDFVLQPLADIEPNWIHPQLNKSVQILLNELTPNEQFILSKS